SSCGARRREAGGAGMRSWSAVVLHVVAGLAGGLVTGAPPVSAQPARRIVIAAGTVLDGRGHVLHNTRIVVEGGKIAAVDPKAGPVDYDLHNMTVLPGWID